MAKKKPVQECVVRIAAEQLLPVPVDQLVPYANNARVRSKEQIAQIRASLREFGFITPVLIDFDYNIIAGHGRVIAAREEGMAEVPCVMVSDLTEAQRKAYILADNRLTERGGWDEELVKIEIEGLAALDFDTGLTGFDIADFGEDADTETDAPLAGEDEDDLEPPEVCPYKPGDVFKLGRHLLVCGDCTQTETTKNFQRGGRASS